MSSTCRSRATPEPSLQCRIAPDRGGETQDIALSGEGLKAAVIAYCISDRIPLPQRGAKKQLQVLGGRLALVITVNVAGERLSYV